MLVLSPPLCDAETIRYNTAADLQWDDASSDWRIQCDNLQQILTEPPNSLRQQYMDKIHRPHLQVGHRMATPDRCNRAQYPDHTYLPER